MVSLARETDDKRRYEIETYVQNDCRDIPGWIFLVPSILSLYGICPHLAVDDQDVAELSVKRRAWLAERTDKGACYWDAHRLLASDEQATEFEGASIASRAELTLAVQNAFGEHPELPGRDKLLDVITSYKQSKNRSKKVKGAWEKTMEDVQHVKDVIGFDMLLYYDVLTGGKVAKASVAEISGGPSDGNVLRDALRTVFAADQAIKSRRDHKNTQYAKATDKLYDLICTGFVVEQGGRYFKRWYYLTDEEKTERIGSFCEHHLGSLVTTNDRARLLNELKDFVALSLKTKALKITEVKWSTKAGKIESIQRLGFDGTSFVLDKVDEEAKQAKRSKTENINGKKKRALERIDVERLDRVLLRQIISTPTHTKDSLITHVLWHCCHCTTPQARACSREHLVAAYDKLLALIRDDKTQKF